MAGSNTFPIDVPGAAVRQADPAADADVLRRLWWEYLHWADGELRRLYGVSMPMDEILEENLADPSPFLPPHGRLLLAGDVGVGCLRRIGEGVGEIKRMYVRPDQRGTGLGRRLLDELLLAADQQGYGTVRLDSVRFMHAAHSLYRSAGFVEISPYAESEIPPELWPHWVFMERRPA